MTNHVVLKIEILNFAVNTLISPFMAITAIWWFEIIIYTAVCLTPANTYPYMYNQCAYFKPIMPIGLRLLG